jgi:iron complex outermembrane receptor protein
VGTFGLSVNGNFLLKYTETVPAQTGFTTTDFVARRAASPISPTPGSRAPA